MKKLTIALAVASAIMCGVATAADCSMEARVPAMPDAATATAENRAAAIQEIKAYQGALEEYRTCLNAKMRDKDLPDEVRQATLDEYNASVDAEEAMVASWQEFNAAFQLASK